MAVRSIEQGMQLRPRQIIDQLLLEALARDRMHPQGNVEAGWCPMFQEAEEGLEGGETGVSRTRRVRAIRFDVIQEVEDQLGIQFLYLHFAGPDAQALGRVTDQELEAIGVAVDGVAAGAPVSGQVLKKIDAEMRRKIGHCTP